MIHFNWLSSLTDHSDSLFPSASQWPRWWRICLQCRRPRFNPCWEDPLEKGMATHSSILAWRSPWTEQPGGLWLMGSQRVRHYWSGNTLSVLVTLASLLLCLNYSGSVFVRDFLYFLIHFLLFPKSFSSLPVIHLPSVLYSCCCFLSLGLVKSFIFLF